MRDRSPLGDHLDIGIERGGALAERCILCGLSLGQHEGGPCNLNGRVRPGTVLVMKITIEELERAVKRARLMNDKTAEILE